MSQSLYTLCMVDKKNPKQQCWKTCAKQPSQCSVFRAVVRGLMVYLNVYKGKQYRKVRNLFCLLKVGNLFCLLNSMEKAATRKMFNFGAASEKAIAKTWVLSKIWGWMVNLQCEFWGTLPLSLSEKMKLKSVYLHIRKEYLVLRSGRTALINPDVKVRQV